MSLALTPAVFYRLDFQEKVFPFQRRNEYVLCLSRNISKSSKRRREDPSNPWVFFLGFWLLTVNSFYL